MCQIDFNISILIMDDGKFLANVRLKGQPPGGNLRAGDNIPFLCGQTVQDFMGANRKLFEEALNPVPGSPFLIDS